MRALSVGTALCTSMPVLPPSPARAASPVMVDAAQLWSAYEAAAQSNGLVTDIFTNGAIHVLSDATAQATERTSLVARVPSTDGPDVARVARFGAFGAADGAVSHAWFLALDSVVGESGTTTETLLKVAADQLVYTPLFCVWFLSAFVLLEGREVRTIPRVLRTEWWELYRGNAGFFLPLTGLIYAYVPRDERVLAFGAGSLVYTWILSLWNSARAEARDAAGQQPLGGVDAGGVGAGGVGVEMGGGDAGSGVELCSLTEDDCVVMPNAPPRARALLSVGVRRVLVRARRTTSRRTQPPAMVLAGHHNECGEGGSKGGREGVGEGGSEGEADTVRDLPRLEEWAALDDGRYTGSVDGRTLWIRAAAVDDADDRDRSSGRLRTLNGEVFLLGTRANRELGRRAASSWATAGTAGTIAGAERETVHVAPTGDVWPALAVLAILSLSNAYGVVPGTCIGPAPTNVPSGGVLGVVASQAAARSTVQGRAPPQLQLRGTDAAADAAVRTAVVDAVFGTSYDGSM